MAESADDPTIYWVEPRERGVIPLDGLNVSARLARTVRSDVFEIRIDTAFDEVLAGCAAPARDREQTWINARIRGLYGELFDMGQAHTVETWRDGKLVGGLYGVRLEAAFFGESMFHRGAGCLEGRPRPSCCALACGWISASRHAVCHTASRQAGRASRSRAGATATFWTKRLRLKPTITRGLKTSE